MDSTTKTGSTLEWFNEALSVASGAEDNTGDSPSLLLSTDDSPIPDWDFQPTTQQDESS